MIAYLKGKILKKIDKGIILDTGNVGYLIHLSAPLLEEILLQQEKEFFIHSQIREDAFDLYGFDKIEDLDFFKSLISVNGIGPKIALEILSTSVEKIKNAIVNEELGYLCKIPGIGQKTAKRLILELKGKIDIDLGKETIDDFNHDAVEALIKLGYQRHHITKNLKELPKEIKKAEDIITYFLKNI